MSKRIVIAAAAISLCLSSLAHSQTLTGSSVTGAIYCCDAPTESNRATNLVTQVVGSDVEFPLGSFTSVVELTAVPVSIDIGVSTIDISYAETATAVMGNFNGFVFSFTGAPEITGVSTDPTSTLSPTSLSFNANTIFVDNAGLSLTPSSRLLINVSAVPEPGKLGAILAGLGAMMLFVRRKQRSP